MPNTYSHVSKKKPSRTYSGEKEGRDVVGWLNRELFVREDIQQIRLALEKISGERGNFRQEQNRVIELLRLYQKSCIEWETIARNANNRNSAGNPDITKNYTKKATAHKILERRLRRYTFYPRFYPLGKGLSFTWEPTRPDRLESYGEISAIADLAKLAEKDLLGHLKECPCGKWIWAKFSHQKFCSAKCREHDFRSSEKWKEHRRKKAREYYRLHKSGKVK
jgi:hypothetical protein